MDGGAWWATVQGVAKSRIRLSDFAYFLSLAVHSLLTVVAFTVAEHRL